LLFLTFNIDTILLKLNDFYKENDLTLMIIKVAVEKNRNSTTIKRKSSSSICSNDQLIPLDDDIYDDVPHNGTFHDTPYDDTPYDDTTYDDTTYDNTSYDDTTYDDTSYDDNISDNNDIYIAKSPVVNKSPAVNKSSVVNKSPAVNKSPVVNARAKSPVAMNTYGKSPIKNTSMLRRTTNTTSRHDNNSYNEIQDFSNNVLSTRDKDESSSNGTPVKSKFVLRYTPKASSMSQSRETSCETSCETLKNYVNLDSSINHVQYHII